MISNRNIRTAMFASAAGFAISGFAGAAALRPVQQGDARYITGGIGDDERQAMDAAAPNYDLHVTNSEPSGDFVANVTFVISSRNGGEVLQARGAGPLFYAQLPPGSYVLHASYHGVDQTKDLSVGGQRHTDLHLVWPAINRQ